MDASDGNEQVDDLLAAAYALDGPEANRALYARWAATYDSEFIIDSGYHYHEHVARIFADHCLDGVSPDEVVVDVGCGTGLAGQSLRRHRPLLIDGIDISPEMLEQAATKHHDGQSVYRRLIEADLTRVLPIETHAYAAAFSAGTFTHGHVGPNALHELLRIVRPGGRLAIGINAAHFAAAGFGEAFDRLHRAKAIGDLQMVDVLIYDGADLHDPDKVAHVATFAVGSG